MNKTKIILTATGGVAAVAVLALAVLTWLAFADRTEAFEGSDGLEGAVSGVTGLMSKKPYPNEANRKRLEDNAQRIEDWCAAVRKGLSAGDWCAPAGCTPAQFKEQIVRESKALIAPKTVGGERIVKADFGFGPFKDYLGDKMPSAEQLPRLQRQWYDLTSLVDVLETNGVTQVTDLQLVDRAAADAAKVEQEAKGKKGKQKQKPKKTVKKAAEPTGGPRLPAVETYRLSFLATPAAFARVIETLSFQDRFTVVEDFNFAHERDVIVERLGGGEKKDSASAPAGGRRRPRRSSLSEDAATAESDEGAKRNAVVFDPDRDSVFKVDLTVSVYDFRSLEEEEKGETK